MKRLTLLRKQNRFIATLLLLILAAFSYFVLPEIFPQDPLTNNSYLAKQLEQQQAQAAGAFVIAKSLNAAISLLQSIDVGFSFGASLTVSPGELLDPANDLIEKISNWLLLASGAILLERILLSINQFIVFTILLPLSLLCLTASLWIPEQSIFNLKNLGKKGALLSLVILLVIPSSVQLSIFLENTILHKTLTEAHTSLQKNSEAVDAISGELLQLTSTNTINTPSNKKAPIPPVPTEQSQSLKNKCTGVLHTIAAHVTNPFHQSTTTNEPALQPSFWDNAKQKWTGFTSTFSYSQLKEKVSTLTRQLEEKANEMTENFLSLLIIFMLNTVLLPLITLWILIQSAKALFSTPVAVSKPLANEDYDHS